MWSQLDHINLIPRLTCTVLHSLDSLFEIYLCKDRGKTLKKKKNQTQWIILVMNKEPTAWRDPFRTTTPWNPERDQIQFKHFSVRYWRIYKPKFFKLSCGAYLYVGMFHRPCHWYGFIESQPSVFMPQYIPKPLHTSTSIIHCARKNRRKWGKNRNLKVCNKKEGEKWKGILTWSHQHSEKFGNWCSRLYSKNSNITLIIIHIHQSRIISVWQTGMMARV